MIKWVDIYQIDLDGASLDSLQSDIDQINRFERGTVEVDGEPYQITSDMLVQGRITIEDRPLDYGDGATVRYVCFRIPMRV